MKLILSIAVLLLLSPALSAQPDSAFRLHKVIKVTATDFAIDNLENLYVLTATDGLKKFNAAGDSLAAFNDVKRFGKLYSIDVSNPLKLLLFYKDFASIVVLDRLLSQQGALDLRRHRMGQVSAVGASYDNNIWVFDALESKLKKLDESGKVLQETVDFRQLFNTSVQPEKIIDQDGWVYLYDSNYGVYVFDHYGSFQKKYPLPRWASVQVLNKRIVGVANNAMTFFNTSTLLQQQYQFPSSFGSFSRYLIGNTKLFALGKDSLSVYDMRLGK
ncbi:MAG: hypothetical protein JWP88_1946 [Flaviaesturariibacter sp.]|nr:hypothetical protein [Flaviaesturariibacter sp.]